MNQKALLVDDAGSKAGQNQRLKELGFSADQVREIREILRPIQGMVITVPARMGMSQLIGNPAMISRFAAGRRTLTGRKGIVL